METARGTTRMLIVYYSRFGSVRALAEAIAEGAQREPNVEMHFLVVDSRGHRIPLHRAAPASPFARGNTHCVFATLTALIPPLNSPAQTPSLDAWGRHEYDAQVNLEAKMRAWLAPPDGGRR